MTGLTPRQRDCLCAIEAFEAQGIFPTYDDLCAAIGTKNKSNVHRLITGLEERGRIRRIPGHARSLELVTPVLPTPNELLAMPLATLERHLGELSGVLAHKGGVTHLRRLFDRIGDRLAGRRTQ